MGKGAGEGDPRRLIKIKIEMVKSPFFPKDISKAYFEARSDNSDTVWVRTSRHNMGDNSNTRVRDDVAQQQRHNMGEDLTIQAIPSQFVEE